MSLRFEAMDVELALFNDDSESENVGDNFEMAKDGVEDGRRIMERRAFSLGWAESIKRLVKIQMSLHQLEIYLLSSGAALMVVFI